MEDEFNEEIKQDSSVLEILAGEPEDLTEERIESPELDLSDFEQEQPPVKEEDPEEEALEFESDPEEATTARKIELDEQGEKMREEFMSIMKPSTIIAFADMILSRGGSAVMTRTDRKDWGLDPEEKEWLALCLDCMIQEEGIKFWPAKVWLILGIIVFYGLKGMDNYTVYYSSRGIDARAPQLKLEEISANIIKETAELDVLEEQAKLEEKRARVMAKIAIAQRAQKEGITVEDMRTQDHHKMDPTKVEKSEVISTQDNPVVRYPFDEYPPHIYAYRDGVIQLKKNGEPKRKNGRSNGSVRRSPIIHPITNKFCSQEEFDRVTAEIAAESEISGITEAQVVA